MILSKKLFYKYAYTFGENKKRDALFALSGLGIGAYSVSNISPKEPAQPHKVSHISMQQPIIKRVISKAGKVLW